MTITINEGRYCRLLIYLLLVILLSMSLFSAEVSIINNKEVELDVIRKLNENSNVSVTIKLNHRNSAIRDSVISSLLGSEFRLKERLLREDGFSGNLTREGLNKLLNNSEVRLIYLNRVASVTTNETNNKPKNQKTNSELNMILIILLILAVLLIVIYLMFKKRKKV